MNEATLNNLLVFLNRAAEAGVIKSTVDAMAFAETYQAVQAALKPAPSKPE